MKLESVWAKPGLDSYRLPALSKTVTLDVGCPLSTAATLKPCAASTTVAKPRFDAVTRRVALSISLVFCHFRSLATETETDSFLLRFHRLSFKYHMTPNPAFSSRSKSSTSCSPSSFSSSIQRSHIHSPNPHAPNCKRLLRTLSDGSTYVTSSSSPTAISRFATIAMRESEVRWSR